MQFQEYVPLVLRTESAKNPFREGFEQESGLSIRMYHSILGIATEVAEILDAIADEDKEIDTVNLLEECGDIFWYLGVYEADKPGTINTDIISSIKTINESVETIRKNSDKLLDHSKKVLMYGKQFDHELAKNCLHGVYFGLVSLIYLCDSTTSNVQETNIAKLKARYPEKFTEECAESRDLEKERIILEGN